MFYSYMQSPVGPLLLAGDRHALSVVRFSSGRKASGPEPGWERYDEPFRHAKRELDEYFQGRRRVFEVPLAPVATPFQAQVLEALERIPYGATRSYLDIARELGNPKAVRAVGHANGRNPIPVIIPCHRVIGADGSLTGFGGGLDTKRFLLDLERSHSGLFSAAG